MPDSAKTQCPYCGVGCGLEALPPAQPGKSINRDKDGTPIWQVRGDRSHPSTHGMICVKGATIAEVLHKNRLLHPMVRENLNEPFRQVSWEEALNLITRRIQQVIRTQGADGLSMYGSGQFQTEDYYVAQKLFKGCLGTNNFDANSRLCMSSAVSAYAQSFGADGPPACYDDLDLTDCAFIIGSNAAECHPILFNRFRRRHKQNQHVKLIVVDPRRTETAEVADLHLAIKPGTDIDLLHGIGALLVRWDAINQDFIDQHTDGFAEYVEVLRHYDPGKVADRCGITIAELTTAATYWAESHRVLSLWSMGINQSSEGTAKARSLINLHLMTKQLGKPGCGPFSLTGQPNAMGGREAGGLSHLLPGYRFVTNPEHRRQVEEFWGLPAGQISEIPGRTAWEIVEALERGNVGLLWVAATNPAVSFPDLVRTKAALRQSPFTIYQECYNPTEMVEFAHVLLPAAQWSEKAGVMTNSERRVTLCPQFRTPAGESRADWSIFAEVGRRLGFGREFSFNSSAEVYAEFVRLTRGQPCDQSALSHEWLGTQGPTQWPFNPPKCDLSDRKVNWFGQPRPVMGYDPKKPSRLYTDYKFHTSNGRAKFIACHAKGLAELPDDRYPFVLTTGRLYEHWHTMSRTGRIPKLMQKYPNPFIEVHPRDADQLGIKSDEWLEVRSARGKARFMVKVTRGIAPGTVFVPMHWGALWAEQSEANALTHAMFCPISKQPELKACAVQLLPIRDGKVVEPAGYMAKKSRKIPLSSVIRS
jgi:ferredoxin-nitrate reductase